ncbi:MAG: EamA family transporter [Chloroflexota bacterium]
MIAILGGTGAALCWAVAVLTTSRAARLIGPWSTLAAVMAIGLVVTVPAMLISSGPVSIGTRELTLMAVIGASNVGGLFLAYTALRGGNVSVVAPILSTEGAIAAVIAVIAGEHLAPGAGPILGAIVIGVVFATREGTNPASAGSDEATAEPVLPHAPPIRTAAVALGAAMAFGVNIYLIGLLGSSLPAIWTALPARVLGTVAVAVPLVALGRFRMTRRALPLVGAAGVAEVAGTVSLAFGARESIAVASVMASQFAAIAAIAAVILFRERLSRIQVLGIATIAVGVALLSILGS